jgi:hypothetical protein
MAIMSVRISVSYDLRFGVKQCKVNSGFVAIFVFCGDFVAGHPWAAVVTIPAQYKVTDEK